MATYSSSVRIPWRGRVEREGPHLVPHAMAFPSAMMSLRVLLGGEHRAHSLSAHGREWRSDEDYFLHLGLSGEGFRFLFDAAEYLRFPEEDDATALLDCFAAEGVPVSLYTARPVAGAQGVWRDEVDLRALVTGTLAQGLPALVLGRTGNDWVLLATGYEEGGDTLVAWTFVPGADLSNKSFDPEDCQYVRDWARGVDGVALVTGERRMGDAPGERTALLRRALARGERFLRHGIGHPPWESGTGLRGVDRPLSRCLALAGSLLRAARDRPRDLGPCGATRVLRRVPRGGGPGVGHRSARPGRRCVSADPRPDVADQCPVRGR